MTGGDHEHHCEVVIVGGGFSGIGAAIRLVQEGVSDFVVLERSGGPGGTWRENRYPGAACDIRSHLYSFSFAPNPGWSRSYSPQAEIEAYLDRCLDRFDLRSRFRSGHEVEAATWDEARQHWRVETPDAAWLAPLLVWATGPLSEPKVPELPGLASFEGTVFHSAAWRHDVDLSGRRVAVVGTGASSIQFVPQIQPLADRLVVHQRTPAWIVPRRDHAVPGWKRALYRRMPVTQAAVRAGIYLQQELLVPMMLGNRQAREVLEGAARRHLAAQVPDPGLRRVLTPDFAIGCKRVLVSDDYYPALSQPNVELVPHAAAGLREAAVVDEAGVAREVDTIIFATGFNASEPSFCSRITGRAGLSLAEAWSAGMEAYLGTLVSGFPNLLLLLGPNTVLGHNSVVFMIESQLNLLVDLVRRQRREGIASIDVRPRVQWSYNRQLQSRLQRSVWSTGGCGSWYLDHRGRNTTLWPGFTWPYRQRTRRLRLGDYVVSRSVGTSPAPTPAQAASPAQSDAQGMPPSTRNTAPVV